jgi:tRNA pseudouridine55 synthase
LSELPELERSGLLAPPQTLLGTAPQITLNESEAGRFLSGLRRRTDAPNAPLAAVFGPALPDHLQSAYLGSAHIQAGELIPSRLLSPVEVGECAAQFSNLTR